MKRVYLVFLAALVMLGILCNSADVYSCGPFFPQAVFVYRDAPDFDMNSYFKGRLGIVQPGYAPVFLYAAYRYFNGRPLSDSERAILMSMSGKEETGWQPAPGYTEWLDARQLVLGRNLALTIPVQADVPSDSGRSYLFYININDDAFHTAAGTLQQRIAQFGAKSPAVADWLHAQDAVFQSEETGKLPEPADSSFPAIIRKDREYQIASAYFYMRKFSVAESLFTAIGRDPDSQWNKVSRYLVARAIIRSATLGTSDQDSVLQVAEAYLKGLLEEPDMKDLYPASERLLSFCMFRTAPKELFAAVAPSIEAHVIGTSFKSKWDDYLELSNVIRDTSFIARYDFTDWLDSFMGSYGQSAFDHAYSRWMAAKSPAWLVSALWLADPSSNEVYSLLKAAESIPPDSPAFPSVTYSRIRLLISAGRNKEANKLIAQMLAADYAPRSATYANLLLSERARTVDNFEDFLKYCHEKPYGSYSEYDGSTQPAGDSTELFTPPASALNKFFPLYLLAKACLNPALPPNLRVCLAQATWVRAFLLDDREVAANLAPTLEESMPGAKPYLDRYLSAGSRDEQKFAAAYLLLKFPGLDPYIRIGEQRGTPSDEIDDYRDNWWYPGDQAVEGSAASSYSYGSNWAEDGSDTSGAPPSFLTRDEISQARKETKEIASLPGASDFLIGIVVGWAKEHGEDLRVPEALHLAVEAGQLGYHGPATTGLAKKAFEILHARYPNSTWSEKTKYYY